MQRRVLLAQAQKRLRHTLDKRRVGRGARLHCLEMAKGSVEAQCDGNMARKKEGREKRSGRLGEFREVLEIRPDGLFDDSRSWIRVGPGQGSHRRWRGDGWLNYPVSRFFRNFCDTTGKRPTLSSPLLPGTYYLPHLFCFLGAIAISNPSKLQ
ncbi:uncharacterized protein GGS22DRAFT_124883 [Annulohypoxylon maeteangense]|uniref:uncharacterized protein n=1 Tax=Annulohypoxylon maeteangense TaxID=1927788 RepID=UPI0020074831|nr:uncharacterized protein GGS22DRAFT_124883 [Annulohypoxylon maeteangense]KAI0886147.1 hypothetical protein GGS22DRAFT_124883 [Annulohypoxylon maeteangense]